jgi:acyl-CoA thioesterase I
MLRTFCSLSPLALAVTFLALPSRAEPRKPTHVACVGDSITAGSGSSAPAKNYPSQLQVLLGNGVQVKNFGNSGSTMLSEGYGDKPYTKQGEYTGATDFVSNAGANALVSVVIILGANDSKPYNWEPANKPKNDQQYLKDYRALVEHFQGLASKPVVYLAYPLSTGTDPCCSIRGDVIEKEQVPLIKQLATEKRLPIIDLNTPTKGHPEYFGDGVHPNDAGYLVMANLVKAGLEREPNVTFTSPMANAMFGLGAQVPLTADAGDSTVDFSSVEFFEGTTSLGKASAKPFTFNWAAPAGMHTVTAKATDTTLATGTSMPLTFTTSTVAAGGSGAGAGGTGGGAGAAAGAAGGPTGGAANGGVGGAASGSAPSAAGSAGAPASAGSAPVTSQAIESDSGCSCAVPGAPASRSFGLLLLASLVALPRLRRRLTRSRV